MRTFASLLASGLAVYVLLLAVLWFMQERILFYPDPLPQGHRFDVDPDVDELTVDVPGAKLSVLHMKLPDPKGVVFFLHGNAGNLASWFSNTPLYREANYDLVMMDYRGYGKSTGRVTSERELRDDVRAVWNVIAPLYAGRKQVIYGRSLGTALAADLSAQLGREGRPPHLTALVSPYSSMRDLASEHYPFVPGALLRYPLETALHLKEVKGRVWMAHGVDDALIGVAHARRLQQHHPHLHLDAIEGAGHNDIHGFPAYQQAFKRELAAL
ncbi:MAG: alpha/beta fold hydrolase [Burkholderiales bacterium]|nr:alpha/beta fold hydrolase [Burkholderiales bacterium]